jgi:chromosome partitioning protein
MSAKIITLLNEKGGVGKTTMTVALACLLAQMGYSVGLFDTDTQGHGAIRLKRKAEDCFYALMEGRPWAEVLRPIEPAYYGGSSQQDGDKKLTNLWILPSAAATRKLDSSLNAHLLIKRLAEISEAFDFIFFDTSPKLGAIHAALFAASDYILIPSECTRMSSEGVVSTINHINAAAVKTQEAGLPMAKLLGIIPTKFNGTKSVHHTMYGWLSGKYGDELLLPPVRFLTDWEKAEAKQMPIHIYSPRSAATADTRALVNHLLAMMENNHAAQS